MAKKAPVGKPFQKGVSGNPGGRPKIAEDLKKVTAFTTPELARIISKYFRMDKPGIKAAGESEVLPMIEVAIARTIHVAARNGDFNKLAPLIERVCGKVKEMIEHSSDSTGPQIVLTLPDNGRSAPLEDKIKDDNDNV